LREKRYIGARYGRFFPGEVPGIGVSSKQASGSHDREDPWVGIFTGKENLPEDCRADHGDEGIILIQFLLAV